MLVISDTSPISNLFVIGRLDVLFQLFGTVIIPQSVEQELGKLTEFGFDIASIINSEWISVRSVTDKSAVLDLTKQLDRGESEAIILARELHADFLLIDERRGWRIANSLGIKTVGLLGILLKAKREGILSSVLPVLIELETKAGFWMSETLRQEVLILAGE